MQNVRPVCPFSIMTVWLIFAMWQPYLFSDILNISAVLWSRDLVHMHAHIHTYMHACMHAYIYTYIDKHIHPCLPTYIHTYLDADLHSYTRACLATTYIDTHSCISANIQTYWHAFNIYVYMYVCINTYMFAYMHEDSLMHMQALIHTYKHIHRYSYMSVYIYTFLHASTHVYSHTCLATHKHACIHTWRHTYIHICACLPTHKHIYMHATYMYVCIHTYMHKYKQAYIHTYRLTDVCMYSYIYAWIQTCMETHPCLIQTVRQRLMFAYKHACMHTYIHTTHTFLPRNIYIILELSISGIFRFAYFQYFNISRISILLEIWKYRNSENMVISTSLIDSYLLLFSI